MSTWRRTWANRFAIFYIRVNEVDSEKVAIKPVIVWLDPRPITYRSDVQELTDFLEHLPD